MRSCIDPSLRPQYVTFVFDLPRTRIVSSFRNMDVSSQQKIDSDVQRLTELGYKQELNRNVSGIANFAVSFSLISILFVIPLLYNTGLAYGGPISMTYGWLIAGFFTMFVALSMAEICSAYPTTGGLYFWSYRLAGSEWGPFASWITGWFNVLGQWTGTAVTDYGLATLLKFIILLSTGGANGGGFLASKYVVLCIHAGFLFIHAIINSLPIVWVSRLGNLGAMWNVIGVLVLIILIPSVSTKRAGLSFVFRHFDTDNSHGIHNKAYLFLLALLMSQATLAGYDASAHMSEETRSADRNGPYGIIGAVALSLIVGWACILGITFTITDLPHLMDPTNDANGYSIAQLFYDVFKSRYGNGIGGIICLMIVAVAGFFCGISGITSNSRLVYALSRDRAIPWSKIWHKVDRRGVPLNAVWLSAGVALITALPTLGSLVAFQATVSTAVIGLYIAYAMPILFRITIGHKTFIPGPWNLGSFSLLVGWIAVLWVAFITVLFSLPVEYPITKESLNYTPIAIGGVLVLVLGSWYSSVRFWYTGPVPNIEKAKNSFP